MANLNYGFRAGSMVTTTVPLDSGGTYPIRAGDFLDVGTAGYFQQAAAGGKVYAIAADDVLEAPSADGYAEVAAYVNEQDIFYYPVGTGTITAAMAFKNCDLAGPQSLDVTASADDNVTIIKCDVANNAAWITFNRPVAGVV